jgi:hypothetical protein
MAFMPFARAWLGARSLLGGRWFVSGCMSYTTTIETAFQGRELGVTVEAVIVSRRADNEPRLAMVVDRVPAEVRLLDADLGGPLDSRAQLSKRHGLDAGTRARQMRRSRRGSTSPSAFLPPLLGLFTVPRGGPVIGNGMGGAREMLIGPEVPVGYAFATNGDRTVSVGGSLTVLLTVL